MSWPTVPMPRTARAIFLLPAGMRAYDGEMLVPFPLPRLLRPNGSDAYQLMHTHVAGEVDHITRALYILGGVHLPSGARLDPDEAHDQ